MHGDNPQDGALAFGPFRLFPKLRTLEVNGAPLNIGARALDILTILAESAGEVISKEDLVAKAWGDVVVDESALRVHISALRKLLEKHSLGVRYIVNVSGRGYCFAAPIRRHPEQARLAIAFSSSIPAHTANIVGRAEAIASVCEDLSLHRLVTIVGPGGIGKTTVALAVGHRQLAAFEEMVKFVDLGALTTAHLATTAIAAALGLTVRLEDPMPSILAFLREKRMLLVLDSCEHLLEGLVLVAEAIVRGAPDISILATSREPLRAEGEQVHRLSPLDCPPLEATTEASVLSYPAAQLFVERVAASVGRFMLKDSEAPLVGEICRNLDGIALALELAAGRVSAYGIEGTAKLLNSRLSLLWRGKRSAIPRHQTLSAALGWSYDLLLPIEGAILRRLSVFAGPFTLDAAIAVTCSAGMSEEWIVEAIANLVAKSLISLSAEKPARYRLLNTTRAFVGGLLIESDETAQISQNHANHFRNLLAGVSASNVVFGKGISFVPYAEHVADVQAALEWSFSERGNRVIGIALATAAAPYFLELSLLTECHRWTKLAIEALDPTSTSERQEMELHAALGVSLMFTRGNTEEVQVALSRSLELAETLDDLEWQLWLLREFHTYFCRIGEYQEALRVSDRGEAIAARLNDTSTLRTAEWMSGVSYHLVGAQDKAVVRCGTASLPHLATRRISMPRIGFDDRVVALVAYARSLWLIGQPIRAIDTARRSVDEAERVQQPLTLGIALVWGTYVSLWVGDLENAGRLVEKLVDHAARHLLGPYQAVGLGLQGELLIRRGEIEVGIDLLRQGSDILRIARHRSIHTLFASTLAEGLVQAERRDQALASIMEAIDQRGKAGRSFDLPEMLRVKGYVLAACARFSEAESTLLQSLELSREHFAMGWELRAAMTLGRLWQSHGETERARALIASVFSRYEEGLDTADLQAARTLLSELAPGSV
ncbi:transcriptional regulator [Bradyrhizobium sp. MOS001]|uniref:ATP-binding protein n=1 Tax=Bradyrhizobium sp. MOS001 TaxID=2133948 RepID=UPI001074B660|nr:winged helix-turn-helix domain-containing protein [Bradyrhizobium sp. MOS001]TFW56694.1 transcriptional regulator [Bradyrhizobium sp. MOS001]